jgi:hypothetical protein
MVRICKSKSGYTKFSMGLNVSAMCHYEPETNRYHKGCLKVIGSIYRKFTQHWAMASYYNHSMEEGTMKTRSLIITAIILISAIVALNPSIAKADILVYDNNNQYLGIMTYMGEDLIDLFIPSLGGTFKYAIDYSGWCGDELQIVFESSNCSGTPYSEGPFPLIFDFSPTPIEGFYKVDYSGKKAFTPGSYYEYPCVCQQNTTSYPNAEYYPYVQVQMPFTTPVALPLRFEVRTKTVVIPLN